MTSAINEAIEGYTETFKDLVREWSDYASGVAKKLDSGYDANSASADLGVGISLAIETGARLTWEAFDALAILMGAPDRPHIVVSEDFSSPLAGAKLTLEKELETRTGEKLPATSTAVIPAKLGPDDTKFRLRVDAAGYPAGVYRGAVLAEASKKTEEVAVRVKVP